MNNKDIMKKELIEEIKSLLINVNNFNNYPFYNIYDKNIKYPFYLKCETKDESPNYEFKYNGYFYYKIENIETNKILFYFNIEEKNNIYLPNINSYFIVDNIKFYTFKKYNLYDLSFDTITYVYNNLLNNEQ